ncbi:MAG: Hpt domain-containing protein [Candidatus Marinimicrobia bacterium]|jgi:HPt (histidine-containing phosphotransfer) domain-containing protein|nr:Hpt domain-containing protein [Candidatus Neomarinimicrobiota bacterium]MBT7785137.1 Hpt domain-containing protein [Candidatus Neomarinimicrobiota bacterium]
MNDKVNNSTNSGDIDPLFLRRLQELGGAKLASELVGMYLTRGAQLLETISAGIDNQDFAVIKNAAHSLISSAGNLGGKQVSDLSKLLETAAIEEQLGKMPDLLSELSTAQEVFQIYLKGALEGL